MALRKQGDYYYGEISDLKELVKRSGNELIYKCVYCKELTGEPDLKGKFYYNQMNAVGHCFKCDTRIISNGLRSVELIRQQLNQVPDEYRYAIQKYNMTGWTWLVTSIECPQLQYMTEKRFISKDTLNHFQVLACESPNEGIVFCNKLFVEDSQYFTDFFQLRQINAFPKYANLRDAVKPLGWTSYVENESIMIVEGFISGMSAYEHLDGMVDPVVLEGKTINKVQISQMKQLCSDNHKIVRIYITLDGGYFEEGIKIARKLERELHGQEIFIVNLPFKKDPNELKKSQFQKVFNEKQYYYTRLSEALVREKAYGKRQ